MLSRHALNDKPGYKPRQDISVVSPEFYADSHRMFLPRRSIMPTRSLVQRQRFASPWAGCIARMTVFRAVLQESCYRMAVTEAFSAAR